MELMSLQQMSISGAVLILAIAVLRAAFLNKLPKKTFLALWEIAVLRLLLPFSIPSPFSVYSWIGRNMSSIPADTDGSTVEAIRTAVLAAPQTINSGSTEGITNRISVWLILWCAGMILCAAFFAVTYLRCLSEFRMSLPVKNDGGFAKEWLNRHPLNRSVTIRQSDRITVPLTYGVFHPVILVPKTMDWREKEQVNCVLLHEYTHIRRYDAVTKLLLILTMCIYWFNPMVWLMVHLANRDLELSCDECVVRQMGGASKAAYARTLIQMEERKSGFAPLMNHFSKNIIEERILAIMKIKKYSKKFSAALALTAVVLVGSVTLVFATSSVKDVVVMESEDGTISYSIENGTTWVVEDDGTVQSPVIEWWTYDEFKEWMEEEIRFLESIADDGEPDYYDDDNVLRDYTLKDVEETASTYQSMLESIKNGIKISKSVDGTDDLCLAMYENSGNVFDTSQEDVSTVVNNETSGSSATEIPGGSVDYSVYEPYGLVYDKENHYYTYNGNVVRFFNDPVAGASFTNFFSGTVDIEAEYDGNKLIGIKECSKEVYDWHTQRHNCMSGLSGGTTSQVGGTASQSWLKDYVDYGITYNTQNDEWYYNNQQIKVLVDGEQPTVYVNEKGSICLVVSRDSNHQISEIKEISDADAQLLLQNNNPVGEDYTTEWGELRYIEDDKVETGSAYSVVFQTENGVVEVGPFESKEELLEVLKPYCDKLVASGELTESEAQAILEKYQ